MSLSVRPVRRITSRSITRSQSFTGVNTQERPYRNLSVFSTPGISRKSSRASGLFTMSTKANPPPKVPQPERLDEVYNALKRGLQSYLHVYQMDLENINRQIRMSKRNSRLGFLYELDKQVRVIERYITKLEFHLSKVEEFYEAYCLQRKLRDGAHKIVKAYTANPGSKEAKESLGEASKGYKECTENMCVMENDFENQLGEFHIRLKGLAGFARLCAGDQYEIFMKYGRQRWKLRGRIEINGKQVWDSEETVFLPLINEFLSVKVTELKSLANHVVVGNVSCEMKDLFAPLTQVVAVDINDLGTLKLSLEVTWNPFDKDDQAGLVNKTPTVSSNILRQPGTPPVRSQPFPIPDDSPDGEVKEPPWSISDSSDDSAGRQSSVPVEPSSPLLMGGLRTSGTEPASFSSHQPEVHYSPPPTEIPNGSSTLKASNIQFAYVGDIPRMMEEEPVTNGLLEELDLVGTISPSPVHGQSYARSLSHISESSTDGFVDSSVGDSGDVTSLMSGISINDIEIPRRTSEPASSSLMHTDIPPSLCVVEEIPNASPIPDPLIHPHEESFFPQVERDEPNRFYPDLEYTNPSTTSRNGTYRAQKVLVTEDRPCVGASWLPGGSDSVVDSELEDALEILLSSLDDYRGQFPELQTLEQNLRLLQVTLKGTSHSRSASLASLSVESALGSFDFLSDCEEEEEKMSNRKMRNGRQEHGDWDSPPLLHSPLTTSCATLDSSLVVHLKNCTTQLLRLGTFGPLCCGEMYALDKLLRETRVFEIILRIVRDNPNQPRQPAEVIPELGHCFGALSLWEQSTECGTVYCVSVENFLSTLSTSYSSMAHGGADAVFLCLVEQILDQRLPRRGNTGKGIITVFQLWSYLESNGISDIEMHIAELAEEVFLVLSLRSTDLDVIINTLRRPPERNLRRGELHAVAKLLKDPRGKVSTSASSLLRGLTAQPTQREQALVHCLELLEDEDIDTRVCGCKALACLKAKESIEQLVYICQTDKEDVRDAAKQALLTLGEEGKMAYRHVEISQDSLPRLFAPGSMASTAF
ncbi:rho family-interacting cell polarization regulator 1 isoform X2 [Xiphophorus couchianus]|nr:rho family-interacting cell polarization regulator 1 isoform X2 [Xiphophorus couchianus]XP_027896423.1 rho family-interacting cell polarization regulator 1 isoform X2 [Xiphophorus couchianus]XP_027896431.1 rho family-interacting cell polarization regulator 1 isoform X2 [Xiphophorus couchianus]XP_027896439.1 rho family-interacting cell polarization regulator 1 isoform X2 [Xiphophorus couchianus]